LHPVTQVDHVAAKRPLNADMMGVLKGSNAIIRMRLAKSPCPERASV
jgi:hypothetical protein